MLEPLVITDDLYLINLLLNVKNPLLLYNMLIVDLNMFLTNIFNIKNIINNPNYNKPLYKNLLNQFTNVPYNLECKENYESFFSLGDISLLNNTILSLDNYIKFNKGFLNLKNFNVSTVFEYADLKTLLNDNNLSLLFNINRLVNVDSTIFIKENIIELTKKEIFNFMKIQTEKFNNELDFFNYKELIQFTSLYKKKLTIKKRQSIGSFSLSTKNKKIKEPLLISENEITEEDNEAMKKFKAKFDKKRQKVQNVFVEYRQ
jgi:hypothetical protein